MKIIRIVLGLILIACIQWKCAEDEVFLSNQNAVQVEFASAYTGNDTTIGKFTAYGIGREDSIIYLDESTQVAFLPLRFDVDTTAYIIKNYSIPDTIVFYHTKNPFYVSATDGFTFNLNIEKVWFSESFIYDMSVDYSPVNYNESTNNVKIYIR